MPGLGLSIRRERTDLAAISLAMMEAGHLSPPALDPAAGSSRDEHDSAVGEVARFEVVVNPVGQLLQAGSVRLDFP